MEQKCSSHFLHVDVRTTQCDTCGLSDYSLSPFIIILSDRFKFLLLRYQSSFVLFLIVYHTVGMQKKELFLTGILTKKIYRFYEGLSNNRSGLIWKEQYGNETFFTISGYISPVKNPCKLLYYTINSYKYGIILLICRWENMY